MGQIDQVDRHLNLDPTSHNLIKHMDTKLGVNQRSISNEGKRMRISC